MEFRFLRTSPIGGTHTLRNVLLALLFPYLSLTTSAPAAIVRAQSPVVHRNHNVDLTLQDDGDLLVRILQYIAFSGEYSTAFFQTPKTYASGIDNARVYEAAAVAVVDAAISVNSPSPA
jgi:hypothetical protein